MVHGTIATPSRAYVHYCSELPNDSFACCQRQAVRSRGCDGAEPERASAGESGYLRGMAARRFPQRLDCHGKRAKLAVSHRRLSPPSRLCSCRSCISATGARGARSGRRPARRKLHCARSRATCCRRREAAFSTNEETTPALNSPPTSPSCRKSLLRPERPSIWRVVLVVRVLGQFLQRFAE